MMMNENGKQLHEQLYNKPLNCKKNIREYIDLVKLKSKGEWAPEAVSNSYEYIDQCINELATQVKANTAVQLKKELQSQLGKFKQEAEAVEEENPFLYFFKEAYPKGTRNKEYTVVLMDLEAIKPEQIITTLKYINKYCKDNRLTREEKASLYPMVEKVLKTNNLKLINQVKSMEWLLGKGNFRIVPLGDSFTVKINTKNE